MRINLTDDLLVIYNALRSAFGHQHWWPAETPFETMIGAILTQNVSWTNAAQAVRNLDEAGLLDPHALAAARAWGSSSPASSRFRTACAAFVQETFWVRMAPIIVSKGVSAGHQCWWPNAERRAL